jgi:hypothetical protein
VTNLGEDRIEFVVRGLEASFDAAVARDEEEAASDLAFSLLQERTLPAMLERSSGVVVVRPDGGRAGVTEVGEDYVREAPPSARLVPLSAAVFESSNDGAPPRRRDLDMTTELRRWARAGATVSATTSAGVVAGRLLRAAPDHLTIRGRRAEHYIGRGALLAIRRTDAGTADGS